MGDGHDLGRLDLLDIPCPDAADKILRQGSGTRKTCRLAGFSPGDGSGRGYYCDRRDTGGISGFHYARIDGRDDWERPGGGGRRSQFAMAGKGLFAAATVKPGTRCRYGRDALSAAPAARAVDVYFAASDGRRALLERRRGQLCAWLERHAEDCGD